jgi:uncharacterized protein with HEPN domain
MSDRERIRLQHMLDAALKARQFIVGRTRADLDSDEMLMLSLTRLLEILGEAAKAVPDEIKYQRPDIPWQQISGTRNRLIHGYYHVDLDIVWAIVTRDLPPLIEALEELLSER